MTYLSLSFPNSQDLIDPGPKIKTALSLFDNDNVVADLAGLYRDDKKDTVHTNDS